MNILEVKNLSYSYGDKKALDNISLSVEKGKITAILGGNGAGKSTLFLNMNGVLHPDEGEILLDGEKINSKSSKNICGKIGIVFQDPNDQLFSESVRDDIAFGAVNIGIDKKTIPALVEDAAKKTGCYEFLDKPTHALSFGQKKRVAIAGVLIMKPQVLILDEPTAGLDPQGVSEILNLLNEIKNESGITVIISTHEIDLIPLYCDYVYILDKGKVALFGEAKKIFDDAETLRKCGLRTPRIHHLMEILNTKDGIGVDTGASTISDARKSIKQLLSDSDKYVVKNSKQMKCGYTTGSCATAASAACALMLITGKEVDAVYITLPSGEKADFFIETPVITNEYAVCSVIKHAGDDPDVTDGARIYSKVSFIESGIEITGGKGVGTVTQDGLQCKKGEAAINPVPRKMITENCREILEKYNCHKGLKVEISVENGEEIAKKTFNPRIGIVGGISILGTTGIVEPMSEKALVDTIKIMIDKRYTQNPYTILIAPGNYGEDFCRNVLKINMGVCEQVSNYIGEAFDYIRYKGFKNILLVGHMGKLIKLAGGVMNTHSAVADCRVEILALYCAMCGADTDFVNRIMQCITTQQAVDIISEQDFYSQVMSKIMDKIVFNCNYRLKDEVKIGIIMFDNKFEHIVKSDNADELIKKVLLIKESE